MIIEFKNWCLTIWPWITKKKMGKVGEILTSDKNGKPIWRKP